jgi:hypothetical protein
VIEWKKYRRPGITEMTQWRDDFDLTTVSISAVDRANGSPKPGDMIASGATFGGVYYAGAEEYDPDFVASVLKADSEPPEAHFNNVVDMLNWLNRD